MPTDPSATVPAAPPGGITATGLHKSYGRGSAAVRVLRGLDLHVAPGTVHALLGPNGAGKTTAVRILATLAEADAGTARVAGYDVRAERSRVRRSVALTGQFAAVDLQQTGAENLRTVARLAGLRRADARRTADGLLDRFGLADAAGRLVATYSGGMRRRLDLAASLVAAPAVLFLDEPTTGLDPHSRRALWSTVAGLRDTGTTVLLTTQYLEEADRLADRVSVLHGGTTVAEGTPAALKSRADGGHRLELVLADRAAYDRLAPRAVTRDPAALTLAVPTAPDAAHVRALLDALDPDRRDIASFSVRGATLDDVFLALTGEPGGAPTPPDTRVPTGEETPDVRTR
ncbi:ATP-binding cassette domain-containing protein [Streptomyces sp. NPDC060194]|uniref:ABC transporter ATP-binding protein n=1 Tax=Streptomyces sp. NPDC060194 TaxID=3347069 RepID=UPI00365B44CD